MSSKKNKKKGKKNYPSSYTLFIPENLDIDKMLEENPPPPAILADFGYRDNFVYIASLPYSIMESFRNRDKEYEIAITEGYVPIDSRALKQKVDNYKPYIDYFKNNGVFECDDKSSANTGKALWYRFPTEYTGVKSVTIKRSSLIRQLINKTKPHIKEDEILEEKTLSEVPYLTKWFNSALRIDMEKVGVFLNNLYQEDMKIKGVGAAKRRENSLYVSALKIDNHNKCGYNLSIDRKGRRFYSPLTNLKRELRAYVTYDNKKLVSLDLKNSQPFFSLVLLDIIAFDKCHVGDILTLYYNYIENKKAKTNKKNISQEEQDKKIALYIEKLRSLIKEEGNKRTFEFKESILDGTFYEIVGVFIDTYHNFIWGEEVTEEDLKKQRDRTKIEIMKIMFGRNANKKAEFDDNGFPINTNLPIQTKIDFNFYFYYVNKIFRLIKKPNYRILAWVLQYIESRVLLYTVCAQIAKENSNIPLFTIHDSIVTTEEHAEYVKSRMIEIIQETIGFTPTIKEEFWNEKAVETWEKTDAELLEELELEETELLEEEEEEIIS